MAKLECTVEGMGIRSLAQRIVEGITARSVSATLEDQSFFACGDVSCAVLVFERYSVVGSNRVSLSVTLFGTDGHVLVSGITAGGSQAVFWKVNTLGEEAFLDELDAVLAGLHA